MMDELALGDYLDQAQHELFRLEVLDAYEVATDGNDFGRCLRGVLSVLAHTLCAALRRRLPGYHAATPDTLQRRFLSTAGIITSHGNQITVRLNRRTYSPVLRQATLPKTVTVPWWGGRTLRYEYA